MFIAEFVAFYKDRYITVFNEERPFGIGKEIHRSSFAVLYDKYERKYVGSSWSGSGPIAGFGISDAEFRKTLVTLNVASDFDKLHVATEDNLTRQWVSAFRNLVGNDTVINAFNRLKEPLFAYKNHIDGVEKKEADKLRGGRSIQLFGRVLSYHKESRRGNHTVTVSWNRVEKAPETIPFTGLPAILPDYRPVIMPTIQGASWNRNAYKSVGAQIIGGNLVLTITHADILYYLHLLKEQQIQNSTWKYRLKHWFGLKKRKNGVTLVKGLDNNPSNPPEPYIEVNLQDFFRK